MVEQLIAIFCDIDDFCKEYEEYCTHHLLLNKKQVIPKTSLSMSEIMTITVYFYLSQYRTFKWYYKNYISEQMRKYFPKLVSYNRFIEIMPSIILPLTLCLISKRFGKSFGINFVDSTTLEVCDPHRIYSTVFFPVWLRAEKVPRVGFMASNSILPSMTEEKFLHFV